MSRRRGDTRRAILATAARLFQLHGYHGFSFHHVAAELGLRTAAVHYHFPAKADLGAAVVARFREDFAWWRSQLDLRDLSGRDRLERFYELDGHYAEQGKVCPLGVVGVEYTGLPATMRAEADALLDQVLAYLEESLRRGRADGSLTFAGDSAAVARQVLAATQGALQLSRVQGTACYESVLDALRVLLAGAPLPAPARD